MCACVCACVRSLCVCVCVLGAEVGRVGCVMHFPAIHLADKPRGCHILTFSVMESSLDPSRVRDSATDQFSASLFGVQCAFYAQKGVNTVALSQAGGRQTQGEREGGEGREGKWNFRILYPAY